MTGFGHLQVLVYLLGIFVGIVFWLLRRVSLGHVA